ncbi:MAG: hypothetical protein RML40_12020 [Bacteroidota bacterium]|nr:hypothetical protein [Candidatus Kapabacteria bacterium]MDW8221242.1 hypothetical protein [Bacteroidota bacterium]
MIYGSTLRTVLIRSTLRSLAVLFCTVLVHAQGYVASTPISVPPQPLALLFDGEALHVLCNQVDANFNGVQDAGDTPAAWVRLLTRGGVIDTERRQTLTFPWGQNFGFPARLALDTVNKLVYVAQGGRIRAFDARTQGLRRDTLLLIDSLARSTFSTSGSVSALSIDIPLGRLFVSLRGRSTSAVVEIDVATSRVLARYPAGIFVQQTIPYRTASGRRGLAILNEGAFGTNTSTLMLARSPQEITTIPLGNTGNHLLRIGDTVVATMNGSHELIVVSLDAERVIRRIPTGTSGFDGPREAAYLALNNTLAVTTYQGFVRFFDYISGATRATVNTNSKTEGIVLTNPTTLYVANAFLAGGFASATSITPIQINLTSVQDQSTLRTAASIVPHPVRQAAHIRLRVPQYYRAAEITMHLYNLLGHAVAELPHLCREEVSGEKTLEALLDADALGLPNGMYILHVRSNTRTLSVPVHILR